MTFKELTNPIKKVRILKSTNCPTYKTREMIGEEFEVRCIMYYDNTITIYTKDKEDFFTFNLSDVQFLTPLKYKGVTIGIGDEVLCDNEWYKVYTSYWFDGEYYVNAVKDNDFQNNCNEMTEENIEDHKPLQSKSESLSGQEVTIKLEDGTELKATFS